jgi:uncharacterized protein (TIGR04255 family)
MKHAPLIYTIGMIQFPRVPHLERYIDKFLELVRAQYPFDDQSTSQTFNANISSDGIKMESPQETKLWQFASVDRKWGIILSDQAFCLHTASYHDFQGFSQRFKEGISTLKKVPDIDISWIRSVGLRYVNLIVPKDKMTLQDYLQPWVLPGEPPKVPLKPIQGICAVRYKTDCGELRLQTLQNPPFILPPELNSPFVLKNGWVKDNPTSEYAVIDIDHGTVYPTPLKFEVNGVINTLGHLRKISRKVFDKIGREKAIKMWEK